MLYADMEQEYNDQTLRIQHGHQETTPSVAAPL